MEIIDESSPLAAITREAIEQLQVLSEKFQAEGCDFTILVTSRDQEGDFDAMAIASTIDDNEELAATLSDVADDYSEPYRDDEDEEPKDDGRTIN